MSEPTKPAPSNSSRIVVIIAVAVLIFVAIAGIVLAGRRAPSPEAAAVAPSALPAPAVAGSTPAGASAPTDEVPRMLVFEPGSDKLPRGSADAVARFADAARASASSVRLTARFLTGDNKARDFELAKARTGAIRHALEADGITSGKVQIEMIEMPVGGMAAGAENRIDLTLR